MLLEATADAMGVKRPGSAPTWLAALVARAISVETMTLDVQTDNAALQALGYCEALVSAGASPERHASTGR